jgi:hypothetical protein
MTQSPTDGTCGDTRALSHREASLVPWDTWRRRSPPVLGGRVLQRGARGNADALPCQEVGSGFVGHVVMPELSRVGRWGLAP